MASYTTEQTISITLDWLELSMLRTILRRAGEGNRLSPGHQALADELITIADRVAADDDACCSGCDSVSEHEDCDCDDVKPIKVNMHAYGLDCTGRRGRRPQGGPERARSRCR